jgi:hypothetical protein
VKLIAPPSKVEEIDFCKACVSWGGITAKSLKVRANITIELVLSETETDSLIVISRVSKSELDDMRSGFLKFNFIAIFFPE